MKKIALLTTALLVAVCSLKAQNANTSASQTTNLALSNAIEISFVNTGTNTGDNTTLSFNSVNDFANGIESTPIQLKVQSNKRFIVRAKTNATRFTYSGATSPAPVMNVQNILFIKVSTNATGGSIPSAVNNKYATLKSSNRNIVNNGVAGGNRTFAVQYKATPGFAYPAGTYTVDVVYTATQN